MSNVQDLKGIIPPLVTPLLSPNKLDRPGTERLLRHVMDGGVSGVFILGSSGEAPSLSHDVQKELIKYTCQVVNHRVPVLVGISDTAVTASVALGQAAKALGADALVLTAPYYYPCSQVELMRYVEAVLEQTELPLFLYNMPALTKVSFEMDTIRDLCRKYPDRIVGIKDSSGDMEYFSNLCRHKQALGKNFKVYMGPEHLSVEAVKLGADGIVPGGANIDPCLFVRLFLEAGGYDDEKVDSTALQLCETRMMALQEIYKIGPAWFVPTKCGCAVYGLTTPVMALPFAALGQKETAEVQKILENLPPMPS